MASWSSITNWLLDTLAKIGEYASFLFTPININVVSKNLDSFYTETNKAGLTNVPTWLYKIFENASQPIYVVPIELLSVGIITAFLIWGLVKSIWSN